MYNDFLKIRLKFLSACKKAGVAENNFNHLIGPNAFCSDINYKNEETRDKFLNPFPSGVPSRTILESQAQMVLYMNNQDVNLDVIYNCVTKASEMLSDRIDLPCLIQKANSYLDIYKQANVKLSKIKNNSYRINKGRERVFKKELLEKIILQDEHLIVSKIDDTISFELHSSLKAFIKSILDDQSNDIMRQSSDWYQRYKRGMRILNTTDFLNKRGCLFLALKTIFNLRDCEELLYFLLKLDISAKDREQRSEILSFTNDSVLITVSELVKSFNFLYGKEPVDMQCPDKKKFLLIKLSDSDNTHFVVMSDFNDCIYDPYFFMKFNMLNRKDLTVDYAYTFDGLFVKIM